VGKRPRHLTDAEWLTVSFDPQKHRSVYHAYCHEVTGGEYDTLVEAFARSDRGKQMYSLHAHGNAPLVERQSEMVPLQRVFLLHAADEHDPDTPDNASSGARTTPTRSASTPSVSSPQSKF